MGGHVSQDVQIFDHAEKSAAYPAPHCSVDGQVMASAAFPDGFDLWNVSAQFGAGATISWSDDHGDEALYIISGRVRHGDEECGASQTILIDSHVVTQIHILEPTELVHSG